MPGAPTLRDSTQIVLPAEQLGAEVRKQLERRFTVTVFEAPTDAVTKVIGSPVEIKRASEFLTRQGVAVP